MAYHTEVEVRCPHCKGHGLVGLGNHGCDYCGGYGAVTPSRAAAYHPRILGEVRCPRCRGTGLIGVINQRQCTLCFGKTTVRKDRAAGQGPPSWLPDEE